MERWACLCSCIALGIKPPSGVDAGTWKWIEAFGATLLISAAPLLLLGLIPLEHAGEDSPLLRVLLAFAAGGLLGDVFLHLLPHTMSGGDGHSLGTGLWLLSGILAFFVIEKAVRAVHGSHEKSGGGHAHARDAHRDDDDDDNNDDEDEDAVVGTTTTKRIKHVSASGVRHRSGSLSRAASLNSIASASARSKGIRSVGALKVHGWLNLVADFAHNFTDGLAIGATFQFQQVFF
jgi:zinc transporter 7